MKVLMLSKALVVGSYQKKLEELSKLKDMELTVIVPPYWYEPDVGRINLERKHFAGYELIVEPMLFNSHFHIHFYPFLYRHIRRVQPDIFHIDEEPFNFATLHAMYLGKRAEARMLFYTWANIYKHYPFPFNLFEKYNFKSASYAMAGNQAANENLRRKGFSKPIAVIPQSGVDTDEFKPYKVRNKDKGMFIIGYVGRIVEQKGVLDLVKAVAGLPKRARLLFIGSGILRPQLEKLGRELGLDERLDFVPNGSSELMPGYLPSKQIPSYLNRLDVLVLPSRTRRNWKEQFGRALLEAMACEVPVVGSDSGEIPNVIGKDGLIFHEGDVDDLRNQLLKLMTDHGLRRYLAKSGRRRVITNYTYIKIAEAHYKAYQEMMGQGNERVVAEGKQVVRGCTEAI